MLKLPTINDIREAIWANVEAVKTGTTTAAQANAMTNAIGKYLSTVKLEMEYCKITGKQPEITLFTVNEEPKVKSLGMR